MRHHFHNVHKTQVLLFNPNSRARPNSLMTSSLRIILRHHVQKYRHRKTMHDVHKSKTTSYRTIMTSTQTDCIHPYLSPSQKKILIGTNSISNCWMKHSSSIAPAQKQSRHHYADQYHKVAIRHHLTHCYHQSATYEDLHGTFHMTLRSTGNRKQSSTSIYIS